MKRITPALLGALLLPSSAVLAAGADMSALESKVAELEKQVQQIQGPAVGARDNMMSKDWMNKEFVTSGNTKLSVSMSGQVNRAGVFVDDGNNSAFENVDNDNSSTRFRVESSAMMNDMFSMGSKFEFQVLANSSADTTQFNTNTGNTTFSGRVFDVWGDWNGMGRVTLGHGSMSSDYMAEQSLAGVSLADYSDVAALAYSMHLRDKNLTDAAFRTAVTNNTAPKIGNAYTNMDGGRAGRIRYDAPMWNGLQASASYADRGYWDASLMHNWENSDFTTLLAVAYRSDSVEDKYTTGSVSVKHKDTGLSLTYNGGKVSRKHTATTTTNLDTKFGYVLGGWDTTLNSWGQTSFGISYFMGEDSVRQRDDSKMWGASVVQHIDALGTELYANARQYDYDDDQAGVDFDKFTLYAVGARVKF